MAGPNNLILNLSALHPNPDMYVEIGYFRNLTRVGTHFRRIT
jgi:hypothetical protein